MLLQFIIRSNFVVAFRGFDATFRGAKGKRPLALGTGQEGTTCPLLPQL